MDPRKDKGSGIVSLCGRLQHPLTRKFGARYDFRTPYGKPNPTQLTDTKLIITDAELSSVALGSSIGNPVLALTHTTRTQLLKHQIYRKPFLNCLHSLYKPQDHEPGQLSHLNDIRNFILYHWSEVLLEKRQDYITYGFLAAGRVRPLDDAIHLNRGLAALLVDKTMDYQELCSEPETETSETISLVEVQVVCISILIHELSRGLLVVSAWI